MGDEVIKIDGENVKGASAGAVMDKLNGPPSTTVSVQVLRDPDMVA